MTYFKPGRRALTFAIVGALLSAISIVPAAARAQTDNVMNATLAVGRSLPITMPSAVTRVSVTDPDVADIVVASDRDVVVNAKKAGETDILIWLAADPVRHYRVSVRSAADRMQVVVSVKFAEVRRDALKELGLSGLYRDGGTRIGSGTLGSDAAIDPATGKVILPFDSQFLTVLSDFSTHNFLSLLEAQAHKGLAQILAEPNIMAGNREDASFLAGGEIPIPIVQPVAAGQVGGISIQYREFGIRLNFNGEIVSDSLVKLKIKPEVSSLDYTNALILSGFRIPALRTRRMESTIDVKRDQSLIISGLFNDEREKIRTGIPVLMNVPIFGALFSSSSWQRSESELIVIVSVATVDPMHPRAADIAPTVPDTTKPAMDALKKRLPPPPVDHHN